METVSPEKDLLTDRVILPEKPSTDVSVIVDVLEPPTGTFTMFGDAVRVKSAVAWATADFTLTASPNIVNVPVGGSSTSTITLTSVEGFSGRVTLSVSKSFSGETVSISPS